MSGAIAALAGSAVWLWCGYWACRANTFYFQTRWPALADRGWQEDSSRWMMPLGPVAWLGMWLFHRDHGAPLRFDRVPPPGDPKRRAFFVANAHWRDDL